MPKSFRAALENLRELRGLFWNHATRFVKVRLALVLALVLHGIRTHPAGAGGAQTHRGSIHRETKRSARCRSAFSSGCMS